MAEKEIYGIIVRPLLTERSTILKEKYNQYVFETQSSATKPDIARAVEELFKVKVEKVRTMNLPGKYRRFGRGGGYRPDWKKAVVTLKEGQKIEFADQAS
jgi:large subunit ribosomal protein L23